MKNWTIQLLVLLAIGMLGPIHSSGAAEGVKPVPRPLRVLQLVVPGATDMARARGLVDMASRHGFTAIQFLLAQNVAMPQAPWKPEEKAWSKAQLLDWLGYARQKGLEVIPEIRLLTHQNRFFHKQHPDLMFNQSTYDPRREETYTRVFALLAEVIAAIHPPAIHIGHDEVAGHNAHSAKKWLRPGEKMLPAELFVMDVRRVHAFLKERGVETWIWGDMLISPAEFPLMKPNQLHGQAPGYGKPLRDQLSKDIVVCDWHYNDGDQQVFPSLATLQQEGFRVIGTTFHQAETVRNFSRYAAVHKAYGMMATTWFLLPRKEWGEAERVIRESGALFMKDFPDAK